MDKRGIIDGKMVTVDTFDNIIKGRQELRNNYIAIEDKERKIALPLRAKSDNRPGAYMGKLFTKFIYPDEDEFDAYSMENVVDLDQTKSMSELISKNNRIKELESINVKVSEGGKVTFIQPDENDTPEMSILKQAINLKRIDLDKYENRFDGNYNNDKRLFFKNSMSIQKIKSSANALDMKVTMIIEDKNPNVPNPIGKRLIAEITGGTEYDYESE